MRPSSKTKVIGLAGGVGCGKTTALSIWERDYGAKILIADELGHLLTEPGYPAYEEIRQQFGGGVVLSDGRLDRGRLAEIVYADRKRLEMLNGIVHPRVREEIRKRLELWQGEPLIVLETAILFETGCDSFCDEVWGILTEREIRIERLKQLRGYTREKAEAVMAQQMSDEELRRRCHRVLENNGNLKNLKETIRNMTDLYIFC